MGLQEQAISVIKKLSPVDKAKSPNGRHAVFVPITDKWAVKIYRDEDIRDASVVRQTAAAEVGLGPQVGASFELGDDYCYITEIAEPLATATQLESLATERAIWEEYDEEIDALIKDLHRHIYWCFIDVHIGNLARLNGNLVCIDFG